MSHSMSKEQHELQRKLSEVICSSRNLTPMDIVGVLHYIATAYTISVAEVARTQNEADDAKKN